MPASFTEMLAKDNKEASRAPLPALYMVVEIPSDCLYATLDGDPEECAAAAKKELREIPSSEEQPNFRSPDTLQEQVYGFPEHRPHPLL